MSGEQGCEPVGGDLQTGPRHPMMCARLGAFAGPSPGWRSCRACFLAPRLQDSRAVGAPRQGLPLRSGQQRGEEVLRGPFCKGAVPSRGPRMTGNCPRTPFPDPDRPVGARTSTVNQTFSLQHLHTAISISKSTAPNPPTCPLWAGKESRVGMGSPDPPRLQLRPVGQLSLAFCA